LAESLTVKDAMIFGKWSESLMNSHRLEEPACWERESGTWLLLASARKLDALNGTMNNLNISAAEY
jgi:hypothetical protein